MTFSEDELERYSRQFVLREIGFAGQKKLKQSKVLVIGAGALGSGSLMYLASAGVGTIGVADYDRVALSNLQRQIIHRTSRVGEDKTTSAEQTLREINPEITLNLHSQRMTVDNIQETMRPYDFVIDAADRFETKFLINDACVLSHKPYSHAGAVRFGGQTMTYVPGRGCCLRCFLDEVPSHARSESCSGAGVLGAVTGVLGSIQAAEAVKYLLDVGELLVGKVLHFDALRMRFRTIEMGNSSPRCKLCGENPEILSLEENREEYEVTACDIPDNAETERSSGNGQ